ncbi:MAG: condensation domain-containing protein [Blastocatellia bacterium]
MNPKQIEEFFHLSPLQKQLLRHSEHTAEDGADLAQFGCYLTGPLDVSAFERAWQKVTNRQPGLRLAFVSGDLKEPVQVVNRSVSVDLEKHDWRNLTNHEQEHRLDELLQADRQCPLILKNAPLWRMALIRLSDEQAYFVWTFHELLFDEHSLPLILNEVLAAYTAILQGKTETLPLPISFRKYVEWIKKKDVHEAETFWRTYLQGIMMPTTLELTGEASTARLSVTAVDRLKLLAADTNLSLDVIVQGAWALLLHRLTGQREVLFGSTVAGRPGEVHGADRIIGHFSHTLPLRVRVAAEQTVREFLTDLQTEQGQWRQYEHNSLTQVQGWSELPTDMPMFQSALVFDGAELESSLRKAINGLEISPERLILPNDFPLTVVVKEDEQGWQITSNEAYSALLGFLLEQFAEDAARRLAVLPWPPPAVAEKAAAAAAPVAPPAPAVPAEWVPTATASDDEQGWVSWLKSGDCVHELFEARAARTPAAIAVQMADGVLTYQQLNTRANQLARYLHKLNVLPSIPVGLCFTPCLDGVVALLGVLKAGGAYMPLDATLAPASLQTVLTENAVAILLTQAQLEPKFRTLPVTNIVLCLDSDWSLIAEEESSNPAFRVSDEHPACCLTEPPTVITHAALAQSLAKLPDWFGFAADNPWHLFCTVPPAPAPVINDEAVLPDLLPDLIELEDDEPVWELDPWSEVMTDPPALSDPPLTAPLLAPIQQAFFAEHPLEPQHGNVSLLVEINEPIDRALLEQALALLIATHEALRWRFTKTEVGWHCSEAPVDAVAVPFEWVDFSAKWARSQRRAIEETADKLQTGLHLSDGPLWRVAYFDLGMNRAHRLLVIFHHLLGDAASLRLLLTDLLEMYGRLRRQQPVASLPPRPAYTQWLQAGQETATKAALAYWQPLAAGSFGALPVDHPEGTNTYGQMDRVFVSLNSAETETLLHHVPQAAQAELNELVLAALAQALAQWTGRPQVLLEVERDVRQQSLTDLDMTRTLGWFAARFPFALETANSTDLTSTLRAVQHRWRAVPAAGVSYGWLRYGPDAAAQAAMRALPQPQLRFQTLHFAPEQLDWQVATENVGVESYPHNECPQMIAVTGALNLNMLEFQWNYARARFEQRTIGVLVNSFIAELRRLISHYSQQTARG